MRLPACAAALVGAVLALVVGALAGPGAARADADVEWAYELSHEVMSPFCPGRTLAACPSPQADELRLWILTQEAAGASRAEVERMLVERYGEDIFAAPPAEGAVGVSAYGVPLAGFALGVAVVVLVLRRVAGSRAEGQEAAPAAGDASSSRRDPADAELERLVDEELRS